jgi:hypothetical protein
MRGKIRVGSMLRAHVTSGAVADEPNLLCGQREDRAVQLSSNSPPAAEVIFHAVVPA